MTINFPGLSTIIWKEIKGLGKKTLIFGLLWGIFWAALSIGNIAVKTRQMIGASGNIKHIVNVFTAYMPLMIMLYIGSSLVVRVFYAEKAQKTIETLFCAPVSLKTIWLGKTTAIFCIAYTGLGSTAIVFIIGVSLVSPGIFPSVPSLLHLLVVSPLFAFAIFGLLGFAYLLLIKPILVTIANMAITFGLIFFIYITLSILSITWQSLGIFFLVSILLVILTAFATRVLDKEKIILTIPNPV